MKITININDNTPKQVVGLQNLTEGFWKRLANDNIIRVGPLQDGSRMYTLFHPNGLSFPETNVLKTSIPGNVASWLTESFEWIESGSITISW